MGRSRGGGGEWWAVRTGGNEVCVGKEGAAGGVGYNTIRWRNEDECFFV
jgi:hypothetical protein